MSTAVDTIKTLRFFDSSKISVFRLIKTSKTRLSKTEKRALSSFISLFWRVAGLEGSGGVLLGKVAKVLLAAFSPGADFLSIFGPTFPENAFKCKTCKMGFQSCFTSIVRPKSSNTEFFPLKTRAISHSPLLSLVEAVFLAEFPRFLAIFKSWSGSDCLALLPGKVLTNL